MKRGTRPVTAYAHAFKALCDQLHVIGRPVDGTDKVHWFLRSTAQHQLLSFMDAFSGYD